MQIIDGWLLTEITGELNLTKTGIYMNYFRLVSDWLKSVSSYFNNRVRHYQYSNKIRSFAASHHSHWVSYWVVDLPSQLSELLAKFNNLSGTFATHSEGLFLLFLGLTPNDPNLINKVAHSSLRFRCLDLCLSKIMIFIQKTCKRVDVCWPVHLMILMRARVELKRSPILLVLFSWIYGRKFYFYVDFHPVWAIESWQVIVT